MSFAEGQLAAAQLRRLDLHVSRCDACALWLTEALRGQSGTAAAERSSISTVFTPGTAVANRFVIQRLVGRGGMGEVYAALDRWEERVVALKTVNAVHCDSQVEMARLSLELRVSQQIHHPNVCRAFATGTHRDAAPPARASARAAPSGFRFLVLDFIEGQTLGQRLRSGGALDVAELRAVARALLHGLEAMHGAGFVHMDIKSDNVMLPTAAEPRAVIIDLGLAQRLPRGSTHLPSGCARGGTVAYMAPEQLLEGYCGPHSDVFGVGVLLFELLTGVRPFAAEDRSALAALRRGRLPLRAAEACPGVPAALDAFIARCTAPEPAARFGDASVARKHFDRLWQ